MLTNAAFVPASAVAAGCYIVDAEGLAYRVSEVRRERGMVSFGLDRNPHLMAPPTGTRRMRPATPVRVLTPEGEALHEGREFSWLPGCEP